MFEAAAGKHRGVAAKRPGLLEATAAVTRAGWNREEAGIPSELLAAALQPKNCKDDKCVR